VSPLGAERYAAGDLRIRFGSLSFEALLAFAEEGWRDQSEKDPVAKAM
jgi:hypothetical protein